MPVTKAVVLCAGEGTRLRPLTYCRPKPLLPVAGRPMLDWILEDIAATGVQETCLVISPGAHGAMSAYVGTGGRWGMAVDLAFQEQPLGLAHATSMAREFVGEDDFLLYLGDNLMEDNLAEFLQSFADSDDMASILVKPVEDPRGFGVAETAGDLVVRLVEKPQQPLSNLAIMGMYAFRANIFNAIDAIEPSARGEYEITDAIQYVADNFGRVSAKVAEGYWQDIGRPEAVLEANRRLIERSKPAQSGTVENSTITGNVTIAAGAQVAFSHIIGPALIAESAVLEQATIGPNVTVGPGAHVHGAHVANCILLEYAHVVGHSGGGLRDSLVGACSSIDCGRVADCAMLVADNTLVKLP